MPPNYNEETDLQGAHPSLTYLSARSISQRLRLEAAGHLENRFLNEQHIENVCESVPRDSAFLYSECIFSERYEAVLHFLLLT